jgi:hypothetical protein
LYIIPKYVIILLDIKIVKNQNSQDKKN